MAHEPGHDGIALRLQLALPVQYEDARLDCGYRIDLLVVNRLIVEVKSVEDINGHSRVPAVDLHEAGRVEELRDAEAGYA